jgi:hypothetical protein
MWNQWQRQLKSMAFFPIRFPQWKSMRNSDGGRAGGGGVDEDPCDEFVARAFSAETCDDFGRVRL